MKIQSTLLALLVCLLVSNLNAQTPRQIASRKIKIVSTRSIDNRKGENTLKMNTTQYDRRGNVLESIDFNKDSVKTSWDQYEYNRHGDETLHRILNVKDGTVSKSIQTKFDKWKREIERSEMNGDGTITESIRWEYNTLDDKISEITVDGSGKILRKTLFVYDKKGMLISRSTYNGEGTLILEKNNTYTY
jgi:hypothetical protein